MKLFQRNKEQGFTLVETLVAITILLLVIIGPITVAQKGIKTAYYANEQITAVFLAQEAIEAIRALRDAKALSVYNGGAGVTWDWYGTLEPSCNPATGCAYDVVSGNFELCTSNNNCALRIDSVTGIYDYESGQESGYIRKVYVTENATQDAVSVRVEMTWQSTVFASLGGGAARSLVLETWLYDQYQRYENF